MLRFTVLEKDSQRIDIVSDSDGTRVTGTDGGCIDSTTEIGRHEEQIERYTREGWTVKSDSAGD